MEYIIRFNDCDNDYLKELHCCSVCPRNCKINRFNSNSGYCRSYSSINIAALCKHSGEEPVISGTNGICNIFFSGCNLHCIYCQNFQISSNSRCVSATEITLDELINEIITLLDQGCHAVGFVSPSHYLNQCKLIIRKIRDTGRHPVFVMNTNSYDNPESIMELEGFIDVYLPDFKYMDTFLANTLSDARDYPEIASLAIKEMLRQKGPGLKINKRGEAEEGLIIRHLVLPGYIDNSLAVLRYIAKEFSTDVFISLMSQYNPIEKVNNHPKLNRRLTSHEYNKVIEEMYKLGFENGWVQDLDSAVIYNPDFNKNDPFI